MEENSERRDHSGPEESKFAYPEGEEVMYEDEHGNSLTPDEFREHLAYLAEHETPEERRSRYKHARDTQRRLLGDDIADALEADAESPESSEDRSHGSPGGSEG